MIVEKIGGERALRPFNPNHFPIKDWLKDQLLGKGSRPKADRRNKVTYTELASDFIAQGKNVSYNLSERTIKLALQACVRELRMVDKMPISGTGPGLWLCETEEDIQIYHTSLSNRIAAQINLLQSVAKWKLK